MINPQPTCVTSFTFQEWWSLDVGIKALEVVDVATVHSVNMQGTILIWVIVLR